MINHSFDSNERFARIPVSIYRDRRLTAIDHCVIGYLLSKTNSWKVSPSNLANELGIDHRSAERSLDRLEKFGYSKPILKETEHRVRRIDSVVSAIPSAPKEAATPPSKAAKEAATPDEGGSHASSEEAATPPSMRQPSPITYAETQAETQAELRKLSYAVESKEAEAQPVANSSPDISGWKPVSLGFLTTSDDPAANTATDIPKPKLFRTASDFLAAAKRAVPRAAKEDSIGDPPDYSHMSDEAYLAMCRAGVSS